MEKGKVKEILEKIGPLPITRPCQCLALGPRGAPDMGSGSIISNVASNTNIAIEEVNSYNVSGKFHAGGIISFSLIRTNVKPSGIKPRVAAQCSCYVKAGSTFKLLPL